MPDPKGKAPHVGNGAGPWGLRTGCMKNVGPVLPTIVWLISIMNRIWFQMCFDYSLILSLCGRGQPSVTSDSVAGLFTPKVLRMEHIQTSLGPMSKTFLFKVFTVLPSLVSVPRCYFLHE